MMVLRGESDSCERVLTLVLEMLVLLLLWRRLLLLLLLLL